MFSHCSIHSASQKLSMVYRYSNTRDEMSALITIHDTSILLNLVAKTTIPFL